MVMIDKYIDKRQTADKIYQNQEPDKHAVLMFVQRRQGESLWPRPSSAHGGPAKLMHSWAA